MSDAINPSSEERQSFTFYLSFEKGIQQLNDADQLGVYRAISRYSLFGEDPKLDGFALMAWEFIRPVLERSRQLFENGKNSGEFGRLGGAPKGNQNARKTTPKQPPKQPLGLNENNPTDTDIDTDTSTRTDVGSKGDCKGETGKPFPVATKRAAFVAPSLEEAVNYFSEIKGTSVDAEAFCDHFTANGWRVGGKSPMKDWKSAARSWMRRKPEYENRQNSKSNESNLKYRTE